MQAADDFVALDLVGEVLAEVLAAQHPLDHLLD